MGEKEEGFAEFKASIDPNKSRWGVLKYEWVKDGTRNISKAVLIAYAPDDGENINAQEKFVVAANKGLISNRVRPNADIQVNKWDDITEELIQSKFKDA